MDRTHDLLASDGWSPPRGLDDVAVSDAGRVTAFAENEWHRATVVLDVRLNAAVPIAAFAVGRWMTHAASGDRLAWIAPPRPRRSWLGALLARLHGGGPPPPPELYVLRRGAAALEPLDGIEPDMAGDPMDPFILDFDFSAPDLSALLLQGAAGWFAYDGGVLDPVPVVPEADLPSASLRRWGPHAVVLSPAGPFRLRPDLTLERLPAFPIAEPWGFVADTAFLE
ncbi:hypothetical protein [Jannaschia sp. LMIT008]|uniref:hypothetical protein n=1 Tax=Jannaschia maritima TaxID=3032585 RepID=UPI0028112A2B|nr:hypothetical protein [Jannaschia sp. LMIT008]